MEITKTYSFIEAASHRPFKSLMEDISDARRKGDMKDEYGNKPFKIIGDMMKPVGNSAIGLSGMDKSKHGDIKYESDPTKIAKQIESAQFKHMEPLDGTYEILRFKRSIKTNNPIHLSIAIYQLAKLRMLEFYYDFIDFYIDRSNFQYLEMDTVSAYIAFSNEHPFENLIKPHLKDHYNEHRHHWFPRDHGEKLKAYDEKTPRLFKTEWRGDALVSLSSKNYICYPPEVENKVKISAKGVQKRKNRSLITPDNFEHVVKNKVKLMATNSGFRIDKESQSIITYQQ